MVGGYGRFGSRRGSGRESQQARDQLGRFGIWRGERQVTPELAARIEELGFGALWLGSASGDLAAAGEFLAATTTLIVATGIVNMWQYEAHQVAASFSGWNSASPAGSCWAWARATLR